MVSEMADRSRFCLKRGRSQRWPLVQRQLMYTYQKGRLLGLLRVRLLYPLKGKFQIVTHRAGIEMVKSKPREVLFPSRDLDVQQDISDQLLAQESQPREAILGDKY